MNDHDGLEPTVAMPRIDVSPAAGPPPYAQPRPMVPPQPIPPQPIGSRGPGAGYAFGNPFLYALRRCLAFGVDVVVVSSVSTTLLYGLIAINPLTGWPNTSEAGFDATLAAGVAIAFIYLWVFEAVLGTTLGKLAFSLHVYAPRHRFVGLGRAFVRNLLRPVDCVVIGWILAVAPGHRRLGDLLGGTVVARSPLRAFSPLVGWLLLFALASVPFLVAGGLVTVLAVGAAFVEFVPPLIARATHALLLLWGSFGGHPPAPAG